MHAVYRIISTGCQLLCQSRQPWTNDKDRNAHPIEQHHAKLLQLPAEIRLLIYDILFPPFDLGDIHSPTVSLTPLLICKLIYLETFSLAFSRACFVLKVHHPTGPHWNPKILVLPSHKLVLVQNITVKWDSPVVRAQHLDIFFQELARQSLRLKHLSFVVTHKYACAPFASKSALALHSVHAYAKYFMEALPLLDNVDKIVIPNPGLVNKYLFRALFDSDAAEDHRDGIITNNLVATNDRMKWSRDRKCKAVVQGNDLNTWRLEITHPDG
ncbi:hypothetical protein B0J11DRAFT_272182 [Dendryphion nanum]|uniref:Uncharacterized protein n=1 Tax=Dendryphion nanum TaxID=256645 RepID=A0A9P9IRF4_9PLEO|nr:hypothetical protein B0J11DRAFT_272182 [Dendryphion nanum]